MLRIELKPFQDLKKKAGLNKGCLSLVGAGRTFRELTHTCGSHTPKSLLLRLLVAEETLLLRLLHSNQPLVHHVQNSKL